ncbi:tRNA CCA-pyrophosphorylase [Listeria fleischmannii 1991]|uniref:CCA-adding enzyme n=2 Tax=Listeria fleischmannii TaxID=1069827 RepID=A0A2X3GN68_9LIST|nr:CCA tRNA nucleotidyltransferase [Listeria fleischmannii]KMT61287.1 tRNA CCA-pyrophosphorylase [Listeria fleischmannii 1991]SQC69778.1 CCA-adding enzyme [Listeria fleischmannii subsp. fleischmannii]
MKPLFKQAVPVLNQLEQAGYEAYFVGGSVRDLLLNREIDDIDIATSAFPEEVKKLFPVTYDTGIAHGTVTVRYEKELYEVTTFRTDGEYEDFRRPKEVTFVRSLEEDLLRRDFTMNAIAMDKNGDFHDPFHGQEAIAAKTISAVGNAKTRFHEDALRMMRAVRFVSQLGFRLDLETKQALFSEIHLLTHTAVERKTVEWVKMMRGKGRSDALRILLEAHMEDYLPQLSGKKKELETLLNFHFIAVPSEKEIWLALLLAVEPTEPKSFLKAWKLPNKTIQVVCEAFRLIKIDVHWDALSAYQAGPEIIDLVETGRAFFTGEKCQTVIQEVYEKLPITARQELSISGTQLMEIYDKPGGAWLKELLIKIEEAVLLKEVENNEEAIRRWLRHGESKS